VPHAVTVRQRVARLRGLGHRRVDGRQADGQARQRVLPLVLFLLQLLLHTLMVLPLLQLLVLLLRGSLLRGLRSKS